MKNCVNLLPWKYRKARVLRLRLAQWSALWAATALAMLGAYFVESARWRTTGERLDALQEQHRPVARLGHQIASLQGRQKELSWRESILRRLDDPRPALTLLALVSQSAAQCSGGLRVEKLSLRVAAEGPKTTAQKDAAAGSAAAAPASPAAGCPRPGSVSIKGVALDNRAAARFALELQQTKAFDRVELKEALEQTVEGKHLCSYLVDCVY